MRPTSWKATTSSQWLAQLDVEYPNIEAALRWTEQTDPTIAAIGLRLASALGYYWFLRSRFGEARRWLEAGCNIGIGTVASLSAYVKSRSL